MLPFVGGGGGGLISPARSKNSDGAPAGVNVVGRRTRMDLKGGMWGGNLLRESLLTYAAPRLTNAS